MKLDYQKLIDEAMLGIVKKALKNTEKYGLEDDQSFYISFRTDFPGVVLSKQVHERYPEEITIVLQYQYRNLKVSNKSFSVNIAFSGIPETIEVPFDSITSFVDPLENFSLQFQSVANEDFYEEEDDLEISKEMENNTVFGKNKSKSTTPVEGQEAGEVIDFNSFKNRGK